MDILSQKTVTTRKTHDCNCCERSFPPKTQMETTTIVYDGIYTWRTCPTCVQLIKSFPSEFEDLDGYFPQGCVREALWDDITPEDLLKHLTEQRCNTQKENK